MKSLVVVDILERYHGETKYRKVVVFTPNRLLAELYIEVSDSDYQRQSKWHIENPVFNLMALSQFLSPIIYSFRGRWFLTYFAILRSRFTLTYWNLNMQSKDVRLVSRPVGLPKQEDFTVVEVDLPDPGEGEILVKNVSLTVDPYMRGRMTDRASYVAGFDLSETLTGGAIGEVVESNNAGFSVGDHVESHMGWREAYVSDGRGLRKLGELKAPASAYLGVLGMPGMTAYVGLLDVGQLKEGETVFVSGAAGAVGSAVGQIAKIKNCTAIGSAGGAEKVSHLVDDLGFDHGIDYQEGNLTQQLMKCAPQGIDVYFDNVGGDHLEAALNCMRPNGRLPLCGAISQYNATEPVPGPRNLAIAIGNQLTLQGFIVSNYNHLRSDFERDMAAWIASGELKYRETIFDGIEHMPEAFIGLFTGTNTGKMIVNVS